MDSLTIYEIKNVIEAVFPELILDWDTETGEVNIISRNHGGIVAYTYHEKWILKAGISDYSIHIAGIINLLEQWDGKTN